MTELWGIYDLDRKDFASRSIGHSSQYIGVIMHAQSKQEVESWLDEPGRYHGNNCEVRCIPAELAHRMYGCICPVHRTRPEPRRNKLSGDINEAASPMRVGVGALMIRADGKVLAASRKTNHDDLGLPGGKIEPGETEMQALVRELEEETGVRAKRYHRLFAAPDGGGYWFVTFLVYEWEGEPTDHEGAIVRWVEPGDLLRTSCSFRQYNRELFEHLGMNPRVPA